jgi:hypothetical protein
MSCLPSTCTEITAIYLVNRLIIRAKGTKPTPCHEVRIRRSPNLIFPPQYIVETCSKPGICIDVIAPFDVSEVFLAPQSESVRVHCSDGVKVVPVTVVKTATSGGTVKLLSGEPVASSRREAVGYSESFDLAEAFQDALKALPPEEHPFPDKLITIRVSEVGGLFGGIVGFHKMFIRIEAE